MHQAHKDEEEKDREKYEGQAWIRYIAKQIEVVSN
jgi:hypothetical protein